MLVNQGQKFCTNISLNCFRIGRVEPNNFPRSVLSAIRLVLKLNILFVCPLKQVSRVVRNRSESTLDLAASQALINAISPSFRPAYYDLTTRSRVNSHPSTVE